MKPVDLRSKIGTVRKIIAKNLIVNGVYAKNFSEDLIVLMYHGIDTAQQTHLNQRFISAKNFEKQIISFKKYFNILSPHFSH